MIPRNRNWRLSPAAANPAPPVNRLAERARHYFARHPEVSPQEFLLDALGRELILREGPGTSPWPAYRPPLTEEDLRIHALLDERLAALHRERHGLWSRVRRLLFGNGLVRWLASGLRHPPAGGVRS
jgi:hypothetical protein